MSKTLEAIWKNGFLDDDAIIIPKVVDLYNQKSQNLIDKFQRMFVINRKAILAAAAILTIASPFFGLTYLGVFIATMLLGLVLIGNNGMKALNQLDKNVNSYEYLKAFSNWRTDMVKNYSRAYTFFYPALFLALMTRFRFSADAHTIINSITLDYPNTVMLLGIPWFFIAAVLAITAILFKFGSTLYRIDVDLVYGSSFRKLDELIAEMEDLRN